MKWHLTPEKKKVFCQEEVFCQGKIYILDVMRFGKVKLLCMAFPQGDPWAQDKPKNAPQNFVGIYHLLFESL